MATNFPLYNNFKVIIASGATQLSSATVKAALVTSAYTPDPAHDEWADVSANEASGTGYDAGGETLTSVTISAYGDDAKIDAADVVWDAITTTFKYVVLYISGTVGGKTNPLIGYIYDTVTSETEVAGGSLTIQWASTGVIVVE